MDRARLLAGARLSAARRQRRWPWRAGSCGVVAIRPLSSARQAGAASASQWRVSCWNQHRVGSFKQQNCPWVPRLKALGVARGEIDHLLSTLLIEYDTDELRAWAETFDIVALQEVDGALREALRDRGRIVESAWHIDGRGIEVDSTVALLLRGEAQRAIQQEARCELLGPPAPGGFRRGGGRARAAREHVALLMREPSCGGQGVASENAERQLIVSSVHLHPPPADGSAYLEYLRPLKDTLQRLLAESQDLADIALLGDFNVAPADFKRLTVCDDFWQSFSPVCPSEGGSVTAHASNPCETGDYMMYRSRGPTPWQCRATGPEDFSGFAAFEEALLADAAARLPALRAQQALERARESLRQAVTSVACLSAPRAPAPPPPGPRPGAGASVVGAVPRPSPPPGPRPEQQDLRGLTLLLESTGQQLEGWTASLEALAHGRAAAGVPSRPTLRKGLFTSDHRPLVYEACASRTDAHQQASAAEPRHAQESVDIPGPPPPAP